MNLCSLTTCRVAVLFCGAVCRGVMSDLSKRAYSGRVGGGGWAEMLVQLSSNVQTNWTWGQDIFPAG
jgi:hypothetical protein